MTPLRRRIDNGGKGRVFMSILEVKNLSIMFGGLCAVDNFNLSLEEGEMVAVIGPNGAGKTTVFNMLTGIYKPTSGEHCVRRQGT